MLAIADGERCCPFQVPGGWRATGPLAPPCGRPVTVRAGKRGCLLVEEADDAPAARLVSGAVARR
jgi:hypothetical protein